MNGTIKDVIKKILTPEQFKFCKKLYTQFRKFLWFNRIPGKEENIRMLWQPEFHYCNYDCNYCSLKAARKGPGKFIWNEGVHLTVLERILRLPFKIDLIIGTGGEPFISPCITDSLIRITKSPNVRSLLVSSNIGVSKEIFKKFLSKCDIKKLCIAAAFHPTQEKNRQRFIDKVRYFVDKGVSIVVIVVAVPDKTTFELMIEFKKQLDSLGIPFFPTALQGTYKGKDYPRSYNKEQKRILSEIMYSKIDYEYKIEMKKPYLCDAGRKYFRLNSKGIISPCMGIPIPMGNIYSGVPKLSSRPMKCKKEECLCQQEYWNTLDFKKRYFNPTHNLHAYEEKLR